MMATGPGPDSPWVFLIVIVMLALVVIVDKRREGRSRSRRQHRACQVIGCDPRPATCWVELAGVWACDRCANELDELSRQKRGSLADPCSITDCSEPVVAVIHGWPLCACHVSQAGVA